jgi:hypothetical protein
VKDAHLLALRERYSWDACRCRNCRRDSTLDNRTRHKTARARLKRDLQRTSHEPEYFEDAEC